MFARRGVEVRDKSSNLSKMYIIPKKNSTQLFVINTFAVQSVQYLCTMNAILCAVLLQEWFYTFCNTKNTIL
jgi:hypothetical protein